MTQVRLLSGTELAVAMGRQTLWRSRLKNGLQTLLIMGSLAVVLAVPGYLLGGTLGVTMSLMAVLIAVYLSSWVPARVILSHTGAGLLRRHHAPELYDLLDTLYERAGLDIDPQLYFAPSPELNAFSVGDRRDGAIAVSEGLLRTLDLRQLAGVLAHEISHLRHGDTRVMSMAAAMTRLTFWLATAVQVMVLLMLPMAMAGEWQVPWLLLFVVVVSPTLSTLLQLALSRNREYTADLEAVAITGDPRGLASALEVLERHNSAWLITLFGRRQLPAWIDWLQSHPPTRERIQRLLEIGESRESGDEGPAMQWHDERPRIHRRPDPLGGRDWIFRRR